jgi:hypothetical protein
VVPLRALQNTADFTGKARPFFKRCLCQVLLAAKDHGSVEEIFGRVAGCAHLQQGLKAILQFAVATELLKPGAGSLVLDKEHQDLALIRLHRAEKALNSKASNRGPSVQAMARG